MIPSHLLGVTSLSEWFSPFPTSSGSIRVVFR
jgi:hypothetical protein